MFCEDTKRQHRIYHQMKQNVTSLIEKQLDRSSHQIAKFPHQAVGVSVDIGVANSSISFANNYGVIE